MPSHTLRLSQFAESQADTFSVELRFDDAPPVRTHFQFKLSPQDQEDLRWYLEDYLQYPLDPAPNIAARVEERMKQIGVELFCNVFESGETARRWWARLQPDLNDTRVEIITTVQDATAIPWELLRDPLTDEPLALRASAFVRAPTDQAQPPKLPHVTEGKIRILLVICRPRAGEDVAFRSVASRIVKSLSDEARGIVQLDVLRPPTFEQLGKVLREAKARGEPYHVVHFDGHGTYAELIPPQKDKSDKEYAELVREILKRLNTVTLGAPRAGKHGYLLFENPQVDENALFVDGPSLGKLLVENDVPTLVLNACQSAMADAPSAPLAATEEKEVGEQVHAFGSLAQEVMDTGVAGVVAMRYVLYVETAKRFVADLYAALAQGQSLGEAVTFGRNQLATNPQREIAYKPIALQDWSVPIVYEASAIELFPRAVGAQHAAPLQITVEKEMTQRGTEIGLPPRPDVGFFGRDETLLALDRAFDSQSIVLLHAFAGSGKTTTAAEFARWYAVTGGVQGPILFTSFENYKPLPRVLDTIGQVFGDALERSGVNWLALSDEQRRAVALNVMQQVPMLWIWDNVEPIAGFPTGTPSAWSEAEQQELVAFLRDARETQAKFLLTSRRAEDKWLGDLPRSIIVPPMPMQERVQLARALAEKSGHRITEVEDWRPLLQFTQGNPLTITVLVGQALRDGFRTREQIVAFVERLRKGETVFADEVSEGRSKSLGASLNYGFENAFTETERRQLALLHFFQGFVNVQVLRAMGQEDWALPVLQGFTDEYGIRLLDRAAEIGLLTGHGGGYYSIHPALPWYFKALFDKYHPGSQSSVASNQARNSQSFAISDQLAATRAFVEAISALGTHYFWQYEGGRTDVIATLQVEERNLLHARQLAIVRGWWRSVIRGMQGLRVLYEHTGRRQEWAGLVDEIMPYFVDAQTDGPVVGREDQWSLVIEYRVRLAMEARQLGEAERLQRKRVEWESKRAATALAANPETLNEVQRNAVRSLAASLGTMGQILEDLGKPESVAFYEEAASLSRRIADSSAEAVAAFNLGKAYMNIPAIHDLENSERWYRRSLELNDESDRLGGAKVLNQLGRVTYERFEKARVADKPEAELLRYLNEAVQYYARALDLLPRNAVDDLAVTHTQLGNIFNDANDLDRALSHYREAIKYTEATGDLYRAGQIRANVAIALSNERRLADAREYTLAALRNFETYGERAADQIEKMKYLLSQIELRMKGG